MKKKLVVSLLFSVIVSAICALLMLNSYLLKNRTYNYAPSWSNDGKYVIYICLKPSVLEVLNVYFGRKAWGDIPYNPRRGEICLVEKDGTSRRQLTRGGSVVGYPLWSPNGNKIAFISERSGNSQLYLITLNEQSNLKPLASEAVVDFAWAPDGKRIIFSTLFDENLYLVNIENDRKESLAKEEVIRFPVWSADGSKIAFSTGQWSNNCNIQIVDIDSRNKDLISQNAVCHDIPAWSPDGSMVAFVGSQGDNVYVFSIIEKRIILELDGRVESLGGLVWGLDGKELFGLAEGKIFSIPLDGTKWNELVTLKNGYSVSTLGGQRISLSPEGNEIVFVGVKDREAAIWKVNLNDLIPTEIAP